MRIVAWNVNGLRACIRKGFHDWLGTARADVVALQEVRAFPRDLEGVLALPRGWSLHLTPAARAGYSGVALLTRERPDALWTGVGAPRFDVEGRLVAARFGRLVVASVYVPKGSGVDRDNSRVPYKLAFSRALFRRVGRWQRAGLRVLVCGDLNTAHRDIDLARPRQNRETSGFLPVERAELQRWLDAGWVDTFRRFEPGPGHYSWWSQRRGLRERNVGWRIDYVLASAAAAPYLRGAFIAPGVRGSDHCPVGVEMHPAVRGRRR